MSYWLYLRNDAGETVKVSGGHDMRGGTYCVGGTEEAELNVTYNYAKHFDFRALEGMTGRESIAVFDAAIARLGDDVNPDYWKPTEGNVKATLKNLRTLAEACPDAAWHVS